MAANGNQDGQAPRKKLTRSEGIWLTVVGVVAIVGALLYRCGFLRFPDKAGFLAKGLQLCLEMHMGHNNCRGATADNRLDFLNVSELRRDEPL